MNALRVAVEMDPPATTKQFRNLLKGYALDMDLSAQTICNIKLRVRLAIKTGRLLSTEHELDRVGAGTGGDNPTVA